MKVSYQYGKSDYIRALTLLAGNRQRDTMLLRLFWKFAVGCAVYLSTAALRDMLLVNDTVSYLAGAAVFFILLLADNPRVLPALLFDRRLASGKIPKGVIGSHEMEAADDMITFTSSGVEHMMRYGNLTRFIVHDDAILFYQQEGAAEYVPARAFGQSHEFKAAIQTLRQTIINGKKADNASLPLPAVRSQGQTDAQYTVSQEQYLQVNALHEGYIRKRRLRNPGTLLKALLIIWIGAGSVKGFASLLQGAQTPMAIVYVYYVLGILTLILGSLVLMRPIWLVNWALKKKLQMKQYPAGFFDSRSIHWTGDWIAYEYGMTGMKLAWSYFTDVLSDGRYLLFYQHDTLVFFAPLMAEGGISLKGLADEANRQIKITSVRSKSTGEERNRHG